MRNATAKKLRRTAEHMTIGRSKKETKKVYKRLKATHKAIKGEI